MFIDLGNLYLQLAALLAAGIPTYQALTLLEPQCSNPLYRHWLRKTAQHVLSGGKLYVCFQSCLFPKFHAAMIAAGEAHGGVDVMLKRAAHAWDQDKKLLLAINRDLFTTKITMAISIFLPVALAPGNLIGYVLLVLFPDVLFLLVMLFGFLMTNSIGLNLGIAEALIVRIPYLGTTLRSATLARFTRTLATLYDCGVPLAESLRLASESSGSAKLRAVIPFVIRAVDRGGSLSSGLCSMFELPPALISLLKTGEESGEVGTMLDHAADILDQDCLHRMDTLKTILSTVAILSAGVRAGVSIVSLYAGGL